MLLSRPIFVDALLAFGTLRPRLSSRFDLAGRSHNKEPPVGAFSRRYAVNCGISRLLKFVGFNSVTDAASAEVAGNRKRNNQQTRIRTVLLTVAVSEIGIKFAAQITIITKEEHTQRS